MPERIAGFIMHHPNTPADRIPIGTTTPRTSPTLARRFAASGDLCRLLFELSTMVPEAEGRKYFDYAGNVADEPSSDAYLAGKAPTAASS